MKPDIYFKHVATSPSGRVRVYKASRQLRNKANGSRYDQGKYDTKRLYTDSTKTKTRTVMLPNIFQYVAISDAIKHVERLAFPAWKFRSTVDKSIPYIWQFDTIAGVNTFMIHGGDSRAVKPDEVYLRMIAKGNGFQYKRGIKR